MQISDMLAQYNRSSATGATATAPQQGVQQLVSAVREMTVGNVFEGTVNDIKNGTVNALDIFAALFVRVTASL